MPATRVHGRVGNLPAEVSSFVGRRREAEQLRRLLENSRLVTLTGSGGVGKTRLAQRVAGKVRPAFPDGVWFVDLSALQDPGLVPAEVGVALGMRDRSARRPSTALSEYLADKQLLLVLDNCEHLLDACGLLLAEILRRAPYARLLATSRQPLGIAGEQVFALAAMSLPDPDRPPPPPEAFVQYEALTLFVERAQAATSDFTVTAENHAAVVELCQALDGVPLAIELAAIRLRTLSPQQILERLDDRFALLTTGDRSGHPRQRSLQALIDWSFELCTRAERALWTRLSVFPGGFDVDAAEEVCADDELDRSAVLETLAGLVDRSLLIAESAGPRMRYRALESVRQYGLARLAGSDEQAALRRRHRDYFKGLAEHAEQQWCGPAQRDWVARLAGVHDNLRAALEFSLSHASEQRAGLALAGSLRLHWYMSGFLGEGRRWLERALAAVPEPCPERAKALWVDAYLRLYQADVRGASFQLEQSRQIAAAVDDPDALAHAVEFQGVVALLNKDWSTAASHFDEALGRHQALGNRHSAIMTLGRWAMAAYSGGDLDRAVACHAAAIAESEACHESWGRSAVLWMHGVVLFDQGDLAQADAVTWESLRIKRAFEDRLGMAQCLEVLAWIAAAGQAYDRAAHLLGVVHPLWRATGGRFFPHLLDRHEHCLATTGKALGAEAFAAAVDEGARMSPDEGVAFALGARPVASAAREDVEDSALTRRERQIAELIAEGMSNKDIAARLVIAQRTAESHVEHIRAKLGFSSRAQISAWVIERRAKR